MNVVMSRPNGRNERKISVSERDSSPKRNNQETSPLTYLGVTFTVYGPLRQKRSYYLVENFEEQFGIPKSFQAEAGTKNSLLDLFKHSSTELTAPFVEFSFLFILKHAESMKPTHLDEETTRKVKTSLSQEVKNWLLEENFYHLSDLAVTIYIQD